MSFPTPTACPKCGDQLSTAIPSARYRGTVVQTCRNNACLHTTRTTIAMVEQPRPRPASLPLEQTVPHAVPPRPAAEPPSAIRRFEEAHQRGTTGKVIKQVRRELRLVSGDDGRSKQIGGGR